MWMNATIAIDLPEDTPPEPDSYKDFEAYDKWYETWIAPTVKNLYEVDCISNIDVHEQGFEL